MQRGPRDPHAVREVVLLVLGCFITLVWAIATLVQVVYPDHPVPSEVHLVMLTVAGAFFGGAAIAGRKANGNGNGKKPDA